MSKTSIRWGWFIGIAICGSSIGSPNCAFAQIIPDGTLPNNSSVKLEGNNSIIEGGTQAGGNLFHSFREFSVPTNGAALFNNAVNIQNIISRVTGGSVSNIDGLIYANGTANLFLINPNGIIFGQNAQLNIGGSFVATTANAIAFGNQGFFSASNPETSSSLLTVNPSALLFNQIKIASIENNSIATGLRVPDGNSLLLVGGDINMDGGGLLAFGGRVELGGLAGTGTVELNEDVNNLRLNFPENVARADISFINGASVNVRAGGSGNIIINAYNLNMAERSNLRAGVDSELGSIDTVSGNVEIKATRSINLNNSFIANAVLPRAVGKGGDINITTGSIALTNGAQLNTVTLGQGDAGSVNINARDTVSFDGVNSDKSQSGVFSVVQPGAVGKGGDINIITRLLSVRNGAQLNANTRSRGDAGSIAIQARDTVSFDGVSSNGVPSRAASQVGDGAVGNGGSINITTGSLLITNGARLSASTLGQGDASSVTIFARDFVFFNGLDSGVFSIVQSKAVGNGGNVTIDSGTVSLNNGATLDTRTQGQGRAGNITIRARDSVSLTGIPTKIVTAVGAGGVGKGGNLDIKATSLSLNDGAQLITAIYTKYFETTDNSIQPAGRGDAGNTNIELTGSVKIAGNKDGISSGIFSLVSPGGIGNGGNIMISSDSLSLTDGALMSASTSGEGNAGTLKINTANAVSISGTSPITGKSSGLFTFTNSLNKGGDITINTHSFTVSDGAVLDARTTNNGNGGNIALNANRVEVLDGGQLLSTTSGRGNAGKITVNATDSIIINGTDATFDSRITQFPTEVTNLSASSGLFVRSSGLGTAGDIEVFSPKIRLDNQGRLTAESESVNGGNINLETDLLLLRRGAQISTTAGTAEAGGNGGNINIDAPSGFIVAVPSENSDISANAYTGNGGRVNIQAFSIYGIQPRSNPTSLSDITASSEFGVNGTVELNTPDIDPNSGLVNLPTIAADTEVAQTCQAGGTLAKSSFTITGRGGLPPNPGEALNTDAVQVDLVSLNPNGNKRSSSFVPSKITTPAPEPIIEATGLALNQKGEVVLTANLPTTTPHSPWLKPASCRAIHNS